MGKKAKDILTYFTIFVVGLFFFFWGLVQAKSFLAPLAVAILLAMVILPVARWFERKGLSRGWASFFSDLLILLFFVLIAGVVAYQVKSFSKDWPQTKQRLEPKVNSLQQFIEDKTGISVQKQDRKVAKKIPGDFSGSGNQAGSNGTNQQQQSKQQSQEMLGGTQSQQSGGSMLFSAGSFVMKFLNFLGTFLLTFIYIFFFLLYRSKFRKAIVGMATEDKQDNTNKIISSSAKVSQNYLFGKLILVVILAILYSIGLSVSGVQHAILISILAAVLTLIPYIGNIIGYGLALAMALFSGGGATGAIGVTVTFAITQFVESYVLEPYIVGDKVNLNPVFTIIVVVLGGAVWGVIGMLIAIPALGVAKVIFDNVPALNPLGYLFGEEDMGGGEQHNNIFSKTKRWALQKSNSK